MRNPDVTVRSRGVIEKCTFCVQRINAGRIQAEKEGRAIQDGEVVTACQAVCPTTAIIFGDLNDPKSQVAHSKTDTRNYGLLTELNTQPRVTYLARLRNPNPALEPAPAAASFGHGA
jgi:molybdopterin-containing oxidoreductase family iron-sulfur binding subunit